MFEKHFCKNCGHDMFFHIEEKDCMKQTEKGLCDCKVPDPVKISFAEQKESAKSLLSEYVDAGKATTNSWKKYLTHLFIAQTLPYLSVTLIQLGMRVATWEYGLTYSLDLVNACIILIYLIGLIKQWNVIIGFLANNFGMFKK